ncbi:MAG TPA: cytochrome c peroxidase [Terriglobales bacterium]|nr:cytochrome c peroxidase [Terriglobales bacterium]
MSTYRTLFLVVILALLTVLPAQAQAPPPSNPLNSLKTVGIAAPKNLNQFLKPGTGTAIDPRAKAAAVALGKALFWDQAVGSDGQACATCHYSAGADTRIQNQVDPGLRSVPPDPNFNSPFFAADIQLAVNHFNFCQDAVSNDIVSSQGVYDTQFGGVGSGVCPSNRTCQTGAMFDVYGEIDASGPASIFQANGVQVRNVEPRNAPTQINAVFNYRNFWDGRARNEFNGVDPIGDLDPTARVLLNVGGTLTPVTLTGKLRLENSSLASQAVGPALSDMEMSYRGRTFPDLGRKLLALTNALPNQHVDPNDSVLGNNKAAGVQSLSGKGINKSYVNLVKAAFQDKWWSGGTDLGNGATTQMANNFSLFWGLAVQMYESTLVANDSPFDRAFDAYNAGKAGNPRTCGTLSDPTPCATGWTPTLQHAVNVFEGKGKCANCHGGPETTNASVRYVNGEKLERMLMKEGVAVYDVGFYNTGVRRCVGDTHGNVTGVCDDAGIGTTIGPLALPLSNLAFFQLLLNNDPSVAPVCANTPEACVVPKVQGLEPRALNPNERIAVVGAFKTPGLRNIALQSPFFHDGGDLALADVVDFYNGGGYFADVNHDNMDPDIEQLNLDDADKAALVALMQAMTDERVRLEKAPFDHPQLFIPNFGELPAVGGNGSAGLRTFEQNLQDPPARP